MSEGPEINVQKGYCPELKPLAGRSDLFAGQCQVARVGMFWDTGGNDRKRLTKGGGKCSLLAKNVI